MSISSQCSHISPLFIHYITPFIHRPSTSSYQTLPILPSILSLPLLPHTIILIERYDRMASFINLLVFYDLCTQTVSYSLSPPILSNTIFQSFLIQNSTHVNNLSIFRLFSLSSPHCHTINPDYPQLQSYNKSHMNYPLPQISGPEASVIQTILDASAQVAAFLRHSPIIVLESTNKFGDTQLQQDVHADDIIQKHLKKNPLIKGFASEERPQLQQFNGQGHGYYVTFDPLDGSSIVVNNFTVGSIFAIWPKTHKKLIGQKIGAQVNAVISLFGPRTTSLFYNTLLDKVQELTFINDKWILSHQHLVIKGKTNIYAPGNLRASEDNEVYKKIMTRWLDSGYTLRYSGGFAPDAAQIMLKGHGIFSNIASDKHKAKLRVLYEVGPIAFLIEKAGGKTITDKRVSLMEVQIKGYDDRVTFAMGSSSEVEMLAHAFTQN